MSWRPNESVPGNDVKWKVVCNHILSNNIPLVLGMYSGSKRYCMPRSYLYLSSNTIFFEGVGV